MSRLPFVLVGGSRLLPASFAPLVADVCACLAARQRFGVVGCCAGADLFALRAFSRLAWPAFAFAIGGADGSGFWSGSAPVAQVAGLAAGVEWWAGGSPLLPLRARLQARTRLAVRCVARAARSAPGCGVVLFPFRRLSGGSLLQARLAARWGLPLTVFPCGFSSLPALQGGSWSPAAPERSATPRSSLGGVWARALRFVPAPSLFPL